MLPHQASIANAAARRGPRRPISGSLGNLSSTVLLYARIMDLYLHEMGQGPTVVVLHGGPGADHGYLLPQFAVLADQARLVFYDQRGGGQSRAGTSTPGWRDH